MRRGASAPVTLPAQPAASGLFLEAAPYRLRPLADGDADSVHRLVNDWSVVRMLSRLPFPYPKTLAEEWIASTRAQTLAGKGYHFAILNAEDRLIGCVGLTRDHSAAHEARLGYWVGRPFWNQGIATIAASRVARWAMANLEVRQLSATVAEDNPNSAAVLRRIGFRETGKTAQHFVARGGEHPVRVFTAGRADLDASSGSAAQMTMEGATMAARRMVLVAAAALVDREGRVLLARRPEGKPMAGLWEFPGGKLEPGETPEAALIRELREELGIEVQGSCLAPFTFASHAYDGFDLLMPLYLCRGWRGTPTGREGQALAWVAPDKLSDYPMPEADLPFIPLLRDLL